MGIKDTSINKYANLKEYIGDKQIEIYKYLIENPRSSRNEISKYSNTPINSVCGRVKELIYLGLVFESNKILCSITNNEVYSLYAVENPNYSLLNLRKKTKNDLIKLNKKHLATIHLLLENFRKNEGRNLQYIKEFAKTGTYEAVKELIQDIDTINNDLVLHEAFLYQDLNYALIFKVQSENRTLFHDVTYNKLNKYLTCNCEDYVFRNKICKHMQKVIKKYGLDYKK